MYVFVKCKKMNKKKNIIDDVTAAILIEKTVALSRPQFWSDFHEIWCVDTLAKY